MLLTRIVMATAVLLLLGGCTGPSVEPPAPEVVSVALWPAITSLLAAVEYYTGIKQRPPLNCTAIPI